MIGRRQTLALVGGAAAALPFAARAQQKAMPVVGMLGFTTLENNAPSNAAIRQGLAETGYVEGRNVAIEYRYAEGRVDRVPALLGDLVARKVDVITAGANVVLQALKAANVTIPIVFIGGPSDPVAAGLAAAPER